MKKRVLSILICICFCCLGSKAQEAVHFNHPLHDFNHAESLFEKEVFGKAQSHYQRFIQSFPLNSTRWQLEDFRKEAELKNALCALVLNQPEAEPLLLSFIDNYPQDQRVNKAGFKLGELYYNQRAYKKAIQSFTSINADYLHTNDQSAYYFKKGYCLFVQKDFSNAKTSFLATKDIQNEYYYPSNYYYGMCNYFEGNYEDAVLSFGRLDGSGKYSVQTPYYISQIYFAEEEYTKLINYAEEILTQPDIEKKKEIHQLVGQSYFIQGQYEKALPHLTFYETHSPRLTREQFYQLAFTQYRVGDYDTAINNFLQLSSEPSELGQNSNYYLADAYLKTEDKIAARAAFQNVSNQDFDPYIQQEALYNYAKLSSELQDISQAVSALQKIDQNTAFYEESRGLLGQLLLKSKDYAQAITVLESLEDRSPALEETYQKVNFYRAVQLMNDGEPEQSLIYFGQAIDIPINLSFVAQSLFWIANIKHESGKYNESLKDLENYFYIVDRIEDMPEASSKSMGFYIQAYNYFKQDEYEKASQAFEESSALINDQTHKQIYLDALVRAGDCQFKLNNYNRALGFYNKAIERANKKNAYAIFQKAMVEGLLGKPFDKILTLEELVDLHGNSSLADDALFQLGDLYFSMNENRLAEIQLLKLVTQYKGQSELVNAAYLKLGLINYNEGVTEKALEFYKEVFKHNPNARESQEALLAIEEIYVEDLANSEAYIAFVESLPGIKLSEFSKDSLSYFTAANQYKNSNYTKAIDGFNQYLGNYSNGFYKTDAHYYRAESLSAIKNYTPSLKDYEKVISSGITDYYENALLKSALICYNHELDFTKAAEYYNLLADYTVDPGRKYESLLGAMNAAYRDSSYQIVIESREKLFENDLINETDKAHIHYLTGKSNFFLKQYEPAIQDFLVVSRFSNNQEAAESRFLMASAHLKASRIQDARLTAENAIKQNSNYPYWVAKCLLLLSDIYVLEGDLFKAKASLEAILENYKGDDEIRELAASRLEGVINLQSEETRIKDENQSDTLELDDGN